MGGRSRTSSSNSSTTNNTTNEVVFSNVDNRVVEGDNAIIGGNTTLNSAGNISGVRIVQTDHGAISRGVGLAASSLDLAEAAVLGSNELAIESIETVVAFTDDVVSNALGFAENIDNERSQETARVIETVSELATVVQTNGESLKDDLTKYAVVGLVLVAGLVIWQSRK